MNRLMLLKLLLLTHVTYGQWNNWNWGHSPQPYIPNNNVAIGYPTAYGLYAGKGGWNNNNFGGGNGAPNAGVGFGAPLRCLNGGAHIGQCRLDQDSICIALGGTCTHGSCCTTPFVSIVGVTTTQTPDMIDGETVRRKSKGRRKIAVGNVVSTTVSPESTDEDSDAMSSSELEEWNKVIEKARTSTTAPVTVEMITVQPYEEEDENKKCASGLRPVGPCSEDSDCPTLHSCENEQCCYLLLQ